MMYKCVKYICIPKVDGDGFETEEVMDIEKGTVWERMSIDFIGGEVHLEDVDECRWIEISFDTLKECFEEVSENDR